MSALSDAKGQNRMRKIEHPYFMTQREIVAHILSTIAAGGQVDDAYWSALYDRSRPWICRLLTREGLPSQDIEDGFHDVYLRVFRLIGSLRYRRAYWNYVRRIVVDVARHHRRKQPPLAGIDVETLQMPEPIPGTLDLAELLEGTLSDPEAKVVELIYIDGYSRQETAEHLHVTVRKVRRIREEAVTKLKIRAA